MAISKEIRDLEKDKFVEVDNTPAVRVSVVSGGSSTPIYSKKVDEVGTSIYVGEAAIASPSSTTVWRIQKIVQTGSVLEILWANGNTNFNNKWDDRLTLSYS